MENTSFNKIAEDYHLKRKKPWRPLIFFIEYLKKKGYSLEGNILDLGCASGRNFKLISRPPNKLIGVDLSIKLLTIAKDNLKDVTLYSQNESNFIQLLLGDITSLPFRPDSLNIIYLIATLHHIKKKSVRKDTILQIFDLLKRKGKLILTVWRKWQKRFRIIFFFELLKRAFNYKYKRQQRIMGLEEFGDKYVPWTISKEQIVYNRFYHFFSKHELMKLLKIFNIVELKITGGPTEKDNFFVLANKTSD